MERKESAKERILQVATDLFYREGIRAVGIDRIIAESGVAKASFYRNFATKDDLIVAYLEQKHERSMSRLDEAQSLYPNDPIAQLIHLFRLEGERMRKPEYRGCPFVNAAVEFPDTSHPAHIAVVNCRRELWDHIRKLARAAGARDPESLTVQLEMLYSGAVVMAYMKKSTFDDKHFYKAALKLLASEVPDYREPAEISAP